MKKLKFGLSILLATILLVSSCEENVTTENEITQETEKVDVDDKKAAKLKVMMHANPLPNYMTVILDNIEVLNIDKKQHQQLLAISKEKRPKAVGMSKKVGELERKLYQSSLDNAKKEVLINDFEESLALRTSLVTTKLDCRDQVLEVLSEQQWNELVVLYKEKMPFNNKTEMTILINHVNPLPNYMQMIRDGVIQLDEAQDDKLSEWSIDNHPKMMELAGRVNKLENDAYDLSINNESREVILQKVAEITALKKQIVITKTDCRDNLISNILSEEQWKDLSSK